MPNGEIHDALQGGVDSDLTMHTFSETVSPPAALVASVTQAVAAFGQVVAFIVNFYCFVPIHHFYSG